MASLAAITLSINKKENSPDISYRDFLKYQNAENSPITRLNWMAAAIMLKTDFSGDLGLIVTEKRSEIISAYYWHKQFIFND